MRFHFRFDSKNGTREAVSSLAILRDVISPSFPQKLEDVDVAIVSCFSQCGPAIRVDKIDGGAILHEHLHRLQVIAHRSQNERRLAILRMHMVQQLHSPLLE